MTGRPYAQPYAPQVPESSYAGAERVTARRSKNGLTDVFSNVGPVSPPGQSGRCWHLGARLAPSDTRPFTGNRGPQLAEA
jgi:hypothetical protein